MDRSRPGSRHGGAETTDAHRRRRRVTSPGRAGDLFLEMAKDTTIQQHPGSTSTQAGSPEQHRMVSRYPQHSNLHPVTMTPISTKQYPSSHSLHSQRAPNPPNTAPPVSSQRYFRTHLSPAIASDSRRASAGEINASMRPFKPSTRPSHLSALAFDSPTSADSSSSYQTTEPSPATHSCADGVDSVGSVTAVSTIWDEAEDLNAKLKQYRNGGRRIRSSGERPDDRPRTGTTWTTTTSGRSSALRQALTADGNAKHQLLRTALERIRGKVDHEVYRQLEKSVANVISASTVLAVKKEEGGPNDAGESQDSRRLRRKIDGLCQSLTDLCIALNSSQQGASATIIESPAAERPRTRGSGGNDLDESPMSYLDQRRARTGNSTRAPSRISETPEPETQTPVKSYQTHQVYATTATNGRTDSVSSERECSPTTFLHPNMPSHSTTSLYRTATSTALSDSQATGSSDRVSTIRAPSRAATEAPSAPSTNGRPLAHRERHATERSTTENRYKSSTHNLNHLQLPTNGFSPTLRKTLATNNSNLSLNSVYSAATYAGESRGASAASRLLQDRLERKRRDMEFSRASHPSQSEAREFLHTGKADAGLRSRGISGSASVANFAQRPSSRGIGH